jgi:hypothetical protein
LFREYRRYSPDFSFRITTTGRATRTPHTRSIRSTVTGEDHEDHRNDRDDHVRSGYCLEWCVLEPGDADSTEESSACWQNDVRTIVTGGQDPEHEKPSRFAIAQDDAIHVIEC